MKLSIVTPSFNQAEFIGQTFDRLLQQTPGLDIEYIIVDAQSTDNTAAVIKTYQPILQQAGIRVHFICEPDNGQSDAINKGWRLATGDIVTYLNSDDFYEPHILGTVIDYFQQHPTIQWAYGGWNLVNRTGEIYTTIQPQTFSRQKLLDYDNIGQPSCFFRRQLLDQFGMLRDDFHLAMDYDLWLRFLTATEPGIIPQVLANMRYYADAKSAQRTKQQVFEIYRIARRYTKPFSYQRWRQRLFCCTGWLVAFFQIDISKRIDRSRSKAA